jgi:hypothetical protein
MYFRRLLPEQLIHMENWTPVGGSHHCEGLGYGVLAKLVPEVGARHDERDDARGGDE